MINKLFLTALTLLTSFSAVSSQEILSASAYDYIGFETFQTAEKYEQDFDYVVEKRFSNAIESLNSYDIDFSDQVFIYYAFPVYYDLELYSNGTEDFLVSFYSNSFYKFYNNSYLGVESVVELQILNYIGTEEELPFMAFTSVGMSQIIEYDKTEKSNDITIYSSFYKFFTGFFPENVVAEYHGIFTFVIVAFLFFLVFGFVFFLFRVIRRLVGFR